MIDAVIDQPAVPATEHWGRHHVLPLRKHVVRERDNGQLCYLLLKGVLAQSKLLRTGARQIVGFQVAGDMFGLSTLATDLHGHDIVALSPVTYLTFSARLLSDLADRSTAVRGALWREIGRDAAISAEWIANLGQRPAYQRLAHVICELDARLGSAGLVTQGRFDWYGTQADLGAATGLSLVHVNKTLRLLDADGLLSWGRVVKIHDRTKLQELACFDPAYLALDRQSLGQVLLSQLGDLRVLSEAKEAFSSLAFQSAPPAAFLNQTAG